jgi:hypothetical protein
MKLYSLSFDLEDPWEIEDILVRRDKEFDKAPMALDIFSPMFPKASISQYTTPELHLPSAIVDRTRVTEREVLKRI